MPGKRFSAGAVVVRPFPDGWRYLLLRVYRTWDFPKGRVESRETPLQAAVREVEEETGIIGRVVAPLGTIDFWFVAEGRRIHKTVRHYLMRRVGGELSDADVEVDEVAWVPLEELADRLAYDTERKLLAKLPEQLTTTAEQTP
jgi:8-oxo-dGTP pyrophosphatase MutT (NUDIX family)